LRQRIVIVGGGFAGMGAARALQDGPLVTLIDRKANFEFLPNIHEIVSGLKKPGTVGLSHERMARDLEQTFLRDEVTAIDPVQKSVITPSRRVPYDALILAPGGGPATNGVGGAETHAHFFHSAADADRVRRRLEALAGLPGRSHVTIVGGGFTGIEVLGEILRKYRKKRRLQVRLIESGRRLMSDWPKVLHRRVKKLAERHDVELRLETRVARVEADHVTLTSGPSLPSHLTIWTAGARAPGFMESAGFAIGPSGWAEVDDTLAGRRFPEVFVAGDAAQLRSRARKQGAEALRLGERAAKNARRFLAGRDLKRFRRDDIPLLVTFGDLSAFVLLEDDTVLEGQALAAGREFVFQESMATIDDISGGRSLRRLAKRMRAGEEKLEWRRSLFPFRALDQLLGMRIHLGS
jgi:NADH dehydrogenase FAD-containing subunit